MQTKFEPYQFNRVADFGTVKSVKNAAGVNVPKFAKQFSLHFYQSKKTITQQYLALKTEYENTIILVARHDSRIADCTKVEIDGKEYTIINYSPDNTSYISYDYVTVKAVEKVGA